MRVEVPEQPLYFSGTEAPAASLEQVVKKRHRPKLKSKSRHHKREDIVMLPERHASPCDGGSTVKSKRRYNLRRLNELPYHLVRCRRVDQLLDEVA